MIRGLAVIAGLLVSVPAYAQNPAPLSPPGAGGSGQTAQLPSQDRGVAAAPAVIQPANPDPGMSVKPPVTGTMPVIPPPGTNGNPSTVIPK